MFSYGPGSKIVQNEVKRLYEQIPDPIWESWKKILWETTALNPAQILPLHRKIASAYHFSLTEHPEWGNRLLFAIQAFHARSVKATLRQHRPQLQLTDPFFDWADDEFSGEILILDTHSFDPFGSSYEKLYPASARKALGEFYTPVSLAELILDRIGAIGEPILDPACGSGIFLLAAADRMLKAGYDGDTILRSLRGFDLNPIAVLMAKANLALRLAVDQESRLPISHRDTILDPPLPEECNRYHLVGNPPWLNWDRLPDFWRKKTQELWRHYGLFSLAGNAIHYGGAKKELAQLMILRCADLYLKEQGRLAMVLPFSIFHTRLSGSGFRRLHLPDGRPLKLVCVDDFSCFNQKLFDQVSEKAAVILLEKGTAPSFPAPVHRWTRWDQEEPTRRMIGPATNEPDAPWVIRIESQWQNPVSYEKSEYQARLGANTGGANGVYWLEYLGPSESNPKLVKVRNRPDLGKTTLPCVETEIESELLYPLLRWGDVGAGSIREPSLWVLLTQDPTRQRGIDESVMQTRYPRTWEYLIQFESILRARAAYKKYLPSAPFYSMYNVGVETMAPMKVVWRRMDARLNAAVVLTLPHPILGTKPIIPQETCVFIPCEHQREADYLVNILNSDELNERIKEFCTGGSKGFGSPKILDYLGIKKYDSHTKNEGMD